MALGAPRAVILRTVISTGATLSVIGVSLGVLASLAASRVLKGFVWGISTVDPVTFAVVALVLIAVAVLASLLPALRAIRLNPVNALRD
jgi:ABC-type antimicrobial peptide transport system permease subunit